MTPELAQKIALNALIWLSDQPEQIGAFLSLSGLSVDELTQSATDPDLQGALLDFVTSDDQLVVAFCDANGLAYDQPMMARQALPGGQVPNWT